MEGGLCRMGVPHGRDSLTPYDKFPKLMMLSAFYLLSMHGCDIFYYDFVRVLLHSYDEFVMDSLHNYDEFHSWRNV